MNQNENLITRIHLLGKPGSGKDTQATRIENSFPKTIAIVSTGDIFRGATSPEGKYGQYYGLLKPHIENTNNGALIPDDIIVRIVNMDLEERLRKGFTTLIYTGYPRTIGQLIEIDKSPKNDIFVFLDCTQENAQLRIKERYEKDIKARRNPREDDKPEKLPKRFETFNNQTLPLVNELQTQKRLITIDANATIKEVAKEIKTRVKY